MCPITNGMEDPMTISDSMIQGYGESAPGSAPKDARDDGWKVSTIVTGGSSGSKPFFLVDFGSDAPIITAIELPVSISETS